jgi:hypothetical protein
MTYAGIEITDADSLDAAADILADVKTWITCPECGGARSITDYSPDRGWINIECPGCVGTGTILVAEPDGDGWESEPPTPAAPAVAAVLPLYRCATCRDTGRAVKSTAFFIGKTVEGFCPDCTPHFDFACRRFVNCGAASKRTGEATPPTAPAQVPFDRAARCGRIAACAA